MTGLQFLADAEFTRRRALARAWRQGYGLGIMFGAGAVLLLWLALGDPFVPEFWTALKGH